MIVIFLGLRGSGKTTAALKLLQSSKRRIIMFSPCPDASNEYLKWMQTQKFIRDTDPPEIWKAAEKERVLRVYQFGSNPDIFEWLKLQKDADILIDDARSVFCTADIRNASLNWNPYTRWSGQRVFITCHFAFKDLKGDLSKWRESADHIYLFGPYKSKKLILQLYDLGNAPMPESEFLDICRSNPERHAFQVL